MTIDISTLSPIQVITSIYVGYFNRAPDPFGLQYWLGRYEEFLDGAEDGDAGLSFTQIAQSFSQQPESTAQYSFFVTPSIASAETFIEAVYANLYNRDSVDAEGLAYWTGRLILAQSGEETFINAQGVEEVLTVGHIIIEMVSGAQDDEFGNARTTVLNKIAAGVDFAQDLADAGIIPEDVADDSAVLAAAQDALADVDDTQASVDEAADKTDAFVTYDGEGRLQAGDDEASGDEDTTISGDVSVNDTDIDGIDVTFAQASDPSNGSVTFNADGTFDYQPDENFNGTDSFTYTVTDEFGAVQTGTVTITVNSVNDDPVAVNLDASTNEDEAVSASVTASDVEDDDADLTYAVSNGPSDGIVTMNPDGTYTYTPNDNFFGQDSFEYTVTDTDGGTDVGTVTITVTGENDVPVALNGAVSTDEDTPILDGDLADAQNPLASDADGDALTFSLVGQAANGSVVLNADGTFTYTPNANYNGSDSFEYSVSDGNGGTASATISISVAAVNDAPVAAPLDITTSEEAAIGSVVTASDVENDALTFALGGPIAAANGTVTMNPDGTFTYTPDQDFNGSDSFTYTVSDGNGGVDTETVTVTVTAVDDAPVAPDVVAAIDEDQQAAASLAATDVDNDDNNITYTVNAAVAGFALQANGDWTFNAGDAAYQSLAAGQTQVVSTSYTATSNGLTDTGSITITVTGVNDDPETADSSISTPEDVAITDGQLTASDVDNGDVLTFSLDTDVQNGTLVLNADGSYTYTPNADFNGEDSFTYTVTDNNGGSDQATVTIDVTPVDDVLTEGQDDVNGGPGNDVVIGSDSTLTVGDRIDLGDGDADVLRIFTGGETNFTETEVSNVEQVIISAGDNDGDGSDDTILDASNWNGVEAWTSLNSRGDVDLDFANGNSIGGGNNEFTAFLDNLTQNTANGNGNSDFDFDGRSSDTSGAADVMNWIIQNLSQTDGRQIGDLTTDGAIETINVTVQNPNSNVDLARIDDIDVSADGPGASTLNVDSPIDVMIGELTQAPNVAVYDNSGGFSALDVITSPFLPTTAGLVQGASVVQSNSVLDGFTNVLPASVTDINVNGDGGLLAEVGDGGVNVNGSDVGADVIEGGTAGDTLIGNGGNDILDGRGGNDNITGGTGFDFLIGGTGNDTVSGGDNNDTILGGDGNDSLLGGSGDDIIDTGDSTGTFTDIVRAGDGSDSVWTRGENLFGRDFIGQAAIFDDLDGGNDNPGGPDTATDELNIVVAGAVDGTADNIDVAGLNDVTDFECINLIGSEFAFTIGNNSNFEAYAVSTAGLGTVVNGTEASAVNFNAAAVTGSSTAAGLGLIGGDGNDTLIGTNGEDTIIGDGDMSGNGGADSLVGNNGDDTFIFNGAGLNADDSVNGGTGDTDTILIDVRDGNAVLDAGIIGVEQVVVGLGRNDVAVKGGLGAVAEFEGDQTVTLNAAFNNGGQDGIIIDGSAMDSDDELTVDHDNGSTSNISAIGGDDDDLFIFDTNFDDGNDSVDGGDDTGVDTFNDFLPGSAFNTTDSGDVLRLTGNNTVTDADLFNVSNTEVLDLNGSDSQSVTLGANAFNNGAGFKVVDARDKGTNAVTINAANFGVGLNGQPDEGLIILVGGDANVTGTGFADTIVMDGLGYDDNIDAGAGDDIIKVRDGSITNDTIIDGGTGTNTVELQNEQGEDIDLFVDLENVTNIQRFTLQTEGDVNEANGDNPNDGDVEDHSITFQGGDIGSVTEITVDGSGGEAEDSLTVVINGDGAVTGEPDTNGTPDVDEDFTFNIIGTDGDDMVVKNNFGLDNNIDFDGGLGDDVLKINGSDLGSTVDFNGETGTDGIDQNGGTIQDDGSLGLSSVEELFSTMDVVNATIGSSFQAAGLERVMFSAGDDSLTIDGGFTNPLQIDLDGTDQGGVGGTDAIDGSNSTADLTVNAVGGGDIEATDSIQGGSNDGDVFNLQVSDDQAAPGAGTDLSGVSGFEALNIEEQLEAPFAVENPDVDNNSSENVNLGSSNFGTITETDFEAGDTLNIDGSTQGQAVDYDGGASSASGSITTNLTGGFNDNIEAGGGNDNVQVGDGNDVVDAGSGNDTVDGGEGSDEIDGGIGNDLLLGGSGEFDDTIDGGEGNDTIIGGADNDPFSDRGDILTGGGGNDTFRYTDFTESNGLNHDFITDFDASGTDADCIELEETVLLNAVGASGAVTGIKFAGNAVSFGSAQSAIGGVNANDGFADYVFQTADGADPAGLWIDVNDDGILNNLDIFIEMDDAAGPFSGDEVKLVDTVAPDAPVITSITDDTGDLDDDFLTNDNTLVVRITFSTATDGTGAREGDDLTVFHPGIAGNSTVVTLDAGNIADGFLDFDITGIPLADGTYPFSAQLTDNAGVNPGQMSPVSAVQNIVVDTAATIDVSNVANNDVDDGFINAVEAGAVVVDGTTTDVNEGATVKVTFTDIGNATVTATTTVKADGTWEILDTDGVDISGLQEGDIDVKAEVTDSAGNMATDDDTTLEKDTLVTINVTILEGAVVNAEEETDLDYLGNVSDHEGNLIFSTFTGLVGGVQQTFDNPDFPAGQGDAAGLFGGSPDISTIGGTGFDEGSVITLTTTVTDQAGNTATATDTAVLDTVGPDVSDITSAIFNVGTGSITFVGPAGTFDASDIDTGEGVFTGTFSDILFTFDDGSGQTADVSQFGPFFGNNDDLVEGDSAINVDGSELFTQLVFPGDADDGLGEFFANTDLGEIAETTGSPTIDLFGEALLDVNGNLMAEVLDIPVGYIISTDDIGETFVIGGSIADELTASNDGDTLTGESGNDTFILSGGAGGVIDFGAAVGAPSDGSILGVIDFAASITDFDAENETIQFNGVDLDAAIADATTAHPAGLVVTDYENGTDTLNFVTFSAGVDTPASGQAGTLIFDEVNNQLRIDLVGNTRWTGSNIDDDAVVGDTGEDDIVIDLTGVTGTVDASDFSIFLAP